MLSLLFRFDAIFLAGPLAEVDQFAAFGAEWPPAMFVAPRHGFAAVRASDDLRHGNSEITENELEFDIVFRDFWPLI